MRRIAPEVLFLFFHSPKKSAVVRIVASAAHQGSETPKRHVKDCVFVKTELAASINPAKAKRTAVTNAILAARPVGF